jgi:flagellar biosynthesis GTPase FlhF
MTSKNKGEPMNEMQTIPAVDPVKCQALESETSSLTRWATGLVIKTDQDYEETGARLTVVKRIRKLIDDTFDPAIAAAYNAHKAACRLKNKFASPVDQAERVVKTKLSEYYDARERERKLAEQKAAEAARKAEEQRRAELEEQARRWEQKGNLEKAEERRAAAAAVHVETQIVTLPPPKAKGVSMRRRWVVASVDKSRLVKAAASDENLLAYLAVDETALARVANATSGAIKIAGVTFREETIVAARSGN